MYAMNTPPFQSLPYGDLEDPSNISNNNNHHHFPSGQNDAEDAGLFDYKVEVEEKEAQVRSVNHDNTNGKPASTELTRTSELTLSFEGQVYVFPAVTPQKVALAFPFLFLWVLVSCVCYFKRM